MIKITKGIRIYLVSFVKQRMILDAALGYNHQTQRWSFDTWAREAETDEEKKTRNKGASERFCRILSKFMKELEAVVHRSLIHTSDVSNKVNWERQEDERQQWNSVLLQKCSLQIV